MTGRSHVFFGVGTGIVAAALSPAISMLHIPLVGLASLLPDIDSTSSRMGRNVKLIGKIFGHRGFFHTPAFLLLLLFIPYEGIRWSFIVGVASLTRFPFSSRTFETTYGCISLPPLPRDATTVIT